MKKLLLKSAFALATLMASATASAHDFEVDGIFYNITSDTDNTVEVTYKGDSNSSFSDEYSGEVNIPASVTYNGITYSVTSIGYSAFYVCSKMDKITIPNSILKIEYFAFNGCTSLTSITIPKSVALIKSMAFSGCSGIVSLQIMQNAETVIEDRAFKDCTNLSTINIPSTVTSINSFAFDNTLWYSNQQAGLIYINNILYKYKGTMPANSSIEIKNGTVSISNAAFAYCTGLASITIPSTITSIGQGAFIDCSNLTTITIPKSVISIGPSLFYGCTNLNEVILEEGNPVYDMRDNCNAIIETKSNKLIAGYKNSTIPNTATAIGTYAFSNCDSLTDIIIPNSISTIEYGAFYDCRNLSSVEFPNSIKTIEDVAFGGCSQLKKITIPNSVISIGGGAFGGCTNLTSISIGNSVEFMSGNPFYNTGWYNNQSDGVIYLDDYCISKKNLTNISGNFTFQDSTKLIAGGIFPTQYGLTSIIIPNSVKTIGDGAFYYCSSVEYVRIGNKVSSIGEGAFRSCEKLNSIDIPNSVTTIGNCAFQHCKSLSTLNLGNNINIIGDKAFQNCSKLSSIVFPKSVKTIRERAFNNTGLTSIISLNQTPPKCYNCVFYGCTDATLYVPKDAFAAYFLDEVWGQFANIKKIETLADSISLSDETLYLNIGDTHTLNSEIIPAEATVPTICWTSDNPLVATVDPYGVVTGVSKGRAAITARAMDGSEVYSTCMVSVEVATSITLSQTEASLPVNDLMTLSYTILPDELTEKTATWSTSNPGVAGFKENADGSISIVGVSNGVATITATTTDGSNLSASCVIKVGTVGIDGIESDDNATEVARYDIHGRLLNEPTPGINIVKMSNGATRKEIIK